MPSIDQLPGFRRLIRIEPRPGAVTAALEDDIHCMAVTLEHDGERIAAVRADMSRWPWSTCPGAKERLTADFTGAPLSGATEGVNKRHNCTHLYDLAALAARYALSDAPLRFEVLTSDEVAGEVVSELRRDGETVMCWTLRDDVVTAPEGPAGRHLMALRDWIATLSGEEREAARMLQWASLVAHGRKYPWVIGSDPSHMPPNCHSFQPEQAQHARRIGDRVDFSAPDSRKPLSGFTGSGFRED